LHKSSKDRTIFKEYCFIILLNCLAKVAKVIATRIVYLAKNSLYSKNILDYKQIEDKIQKSTINIVLNLIHNAQIVKNRDNMLFCLLIDVEEAFDYVLLIQLVNILKKLDISINIII